MDIFMYIFYPNIQMDIWINYLSKIIAYNLHLYKTGNNNREWNTLLIQFSSVQSLSRVRLNLHKSYHGYKFSHLLWFQFKMF